MIKEVLDTEVKGYWYTYEHDPLQSSFAIGPLSLLSWDMAKRSVEKDDKLYIVGMKENFYKTWSQKPWAECVELNRKLIQKIFSVKIITL
jgi:hypothetical protein